jgi:60 kDa SS-A/Ro ribonucleoprotein
MQMLKYQARDGWSSRDLLRLAHPTPKTEDHKALYRWATQGYDDVQAEGLIVPPVISAFEEAKTATELSRVLKLITDYKLPREGIPTQWLTKPEVWEAMLPHMGLTAMIRNIATMTRVGLVAPLSKTTKEIIAKLGDSTALKKARIHPIQVLSALLTYQSGRSVRGSSTWTPVQPVVDALDGAFYGTFKNVEPTGKDTLLAIDVSSSMTWGNIAGVPGLTPRSGSAAMALITANVETSYHIMGFARELVDLPISPSMRLDQVIKVIDSTPMGSTDCAKPFTTAQSRKWPVEVFHVYTDSETNNYGGEQPAQALKKYRKSSGINAKSAVIAMVSNGFTIADPNDAGMLDVVGFDTATPAVLADFARGARAGSSTTQVEEVQDEE